MKILVPIDFSLHAKNAAVYAVEMAEKLAAEVVLFHLLCIQAPPHASILKVQNLEKAMAENAQQDCAQLTNELKSQHKSLSISYQIINDLDLKLVMENYGIHNNIDLIVIGTKGATGLSKMLIGSNTAAVISYSSIPVIAVPFHARFSGLNDVTYATDMTFLNKEITALIPLVKKFKSNLQILHILNPSSKKRINPTKLTNDLRTKYLYEKISFSVYLQPNIENGILEFLSTNPCDLLVMFTQHSGFFDKLFQKSSTREIAFHANTPLFSFNKNLISTMQIKTLRYIGLAVLSSNLSVPIFLNFFALIMSRLVSGSAYRIFKCIML